MPNGSFSFALHTVHNSIVVLIIGGHHLGTLRPHRLKHLLEVAGRTRQVVGRAPRFPRFTELLPHWAFSGEISVPAASADDLSF